MSTAYVVSQLCAQCAEKCVVRSQTYERRVRDNVMSLPRLGCVEKKTLEGGQESEEFSYKFVRPSIVFSPTPDAHLVE